MTPIYNQLLIPFLTAMVVAITMGGSGTAPAFSASYGANVIEKIPYPRSLWDYGLCRRISSW